MVEAMQYRESFDGSLPIHDFCGPALVRVGEDAELAIRTPVGPMLVRDGDWIVEGVVGEFYPINSDVFDAIYEPVDP